MKSTRAWRRGILAASIMATGVICWPAASRAADAPSPDPQRFEKAIQTFEAWDRKNATPRDAILFVGSSSIRMWQTAVSFPNWPVINRGFGGSHISDCVYYMDRIVIPYRPRVIVFYAGDNDIAAGKSPERVLEDYKTFVKRTLEALPDTHIAFLSIKPSVLRWEFWPAMDKANELIRKFTEGDDRLTFIDIGPTLLGDDGKPRKELFLGDGLHLDEAGYARWNDVVRKALKGVVSEGRTRRDPGGQAPPMPPGSQADLVPATRGVGA